MHAFEVLGDPVRRRALEMLGGGERAAGEIVEVMRDEFAITQAAVSQHLKVLRDHGFASVRIHGARRIYTLDADPLREVDAWLEPFRRFWEPKLDALGTEIARGRRG
ncbi:MAG: winged helix-turn-helix transcriptional regulator [Gammaproteobacteria bacterium]|nr:winged helix-turn-helix transcriptional regulator [Gammaproteobacteria bacterium]